jgi:hypothetical protein
MSKDIIRKRFASEDKVMIEQRLELLRIKIREKYLVSKELGYDTGMHHPSLEKKLASVILKIGPDLRNRAYRRIQKRNAFM